MINNEECSCQKTNPAVWVSSLIKTRRAREYSASAFYLMGSRTCYESWSLLGLQDPSSDDRGHLRRYLFILPSRCIILVQCRQRLCRWYLVDRA